MELRLENDEAFLGSYGYAEEEEEEQKLSIVFLLKNAEENLHTPMEPEVLRLKQTNLVLK